MISRPCSLARIFYTSWPSYKLFSHMSALMNLEHCFMHISCWQWSRSLGSWAKYISCFRNDARTNHSKADRMTIVWLSIHPGPTEILILNVQLFCRCIALAVCRVCSQKWPQHCICFCVQLLDVFLRCKHVSNCRFKPYFSALHIFQ